MANPYVGTTVMVDVTGLLKGCRESGRPFFLSFLYCAGRAANAVPELRRRIVGDEVREYERCDTSHTVLRPDGSYGFCRVNCMLPFEEYLKQAAERHERAKHEPEGYAEDETDLRTATRASPGGNTRRRASGSPCPCRCLLTTRWWTACTSAGFTPRWRRSCAPGR